MDKLYLVRHTDIALKSIQRGFTDDSGVFENHTNLKISVKSFYFYEDPMTKRNPLNNRFRIGLFNDGKWTSIETDTTEEMMSVLELLNVKRKEQ